MNFDETKAVLAKIQLQDRRPVDEATVMAWQETFANTHVTVDLALDAVSEHYAKTRDWIMPFDIISHVRLIHKRRMQDAGPPDYPSDLTQAQERDYRDLWLAHVKRGSPAAEATTLTDEAMHVNRFALIEAPDAVRKAIAQFTADRTIR